MEKKELHVFDEIFKALDSVMDFSEEGNVDGIQVLGALLTLSDENFENVKPIFLANIEQVFNNVETKVAMAQMINNNGLSVEDFEGNMDVLVQAINELATEGIELSESKKDFLKQIFAIFINSINSSKAISHRIIQIPIQKLNPNIKLPTYATDGSAAMDIYSPEEYTIAPGEIVKIPVGFKVDIPFGYALLIQARSGLSLKTKLRIANTPGLIDSDYHEEICVLVENIDAPIKEANIITTDDGAIEDANLYGSSYTIGKGERFAQMRLIEVPLVNWLEVSSIGEFQSDHKEGFGSTGTN